MCVHVYMYSLRYYLLYLQPIQSCLYPYNYPLTFSPYTFYTMTRIPQIQPHSFNIHNIQYTHVCVRRQDAYLTPLYVGIPMCVYLYTRVEPICSYAGVYMGTCIRVYIDCVLDNAPRTSCHAHVPIPTCYSTHHTHPYML